MQQIRNNLKGTFVTDQEFISDFAKFKHVLAEETFAFTIDTQTAAAKISCSNGTQSITD
jgi:hypothetical protein